MANGLRPLTDEEWAARHHSGTWRKSASARGVCRGGKGLRAEMADGYGRLWFSYGPPASGPFGNRLNRIDDATAHIDRTARARLVLDGISEWRGAYSVRVRMDGCYWWTFGIESLEQAQLHADAVTAKGVSNVVMFRTRAG